ncbi:hypothetical protein HID58_041593, partial [Brassica napus]
PKVINLPILSHSLWFILLSTISVASASSIPRSFSCTLRSSSLSVYSNPSSSATITTDSEPFSLGHRAHKDFRILHNVLNLNISVYFSLLIEFSNAMQPFDLETNYYEFYNSNVHRGIHYLSAKAWDDNFVQCRWFQ